MEETENRDSEETFTSEFMDGFEQWKNTETIETTDNLSINALIFDDDEEYLDPFNPDHQQALIQRNFGDAQQQ